MTKHTPKLPPRAMRVSTLAMVLALSSPFGPALAQVDGTVMPVQRDGEPATVRATVPELFMSTGRQFVAHSTALQEARAAFDACVSAAGRTATTSAIREAAGANPSPAGSDQMLNQGACALAYFEARIRVAQNIAADGLEAEQAMLDQARELTASATQAEVERAAAATREQTARAQRAAVLESFQERAAQLEAIPQDAWTRDQVLEAGEFRRLFAGAAEAEAEAHRQAITAEQRSTFLAGLAHRLERFGTGLGEVGRDQQVVIQRSSHRIAAIQDGASMMTLQSITMEGATSISAALDVLMGQVNDPDLPAALIGGPAAEAPLPDFPGASGAWSLSQIYAQSGIDLSAAANTGQEVGQ